jgi:predicted ArsR family transcriptional regulator
MSVSRDSILAIIRRNDGASVDVLADEVVLAPATVRRHLDILERDGLIDHIEVRRPTGRPRHVFDLTEKGHDSVPKDYSRLLNELVQDIKNIAASAFTVPKACVPRPNCQPLQRLGVPPMSTTIHQYLL